ncbi:MAG: tol-pal system-associated acyl-CoA thioesterase [Wenzhouxiangellaceae bacterium]|nr:tol-pal system-associated acyl-CoA thioesterase [Wenzhouxiangellaceae bacterium]
MTARFRYRVYWEDTDGGGVVYHARYLHFLERARSDWLSALGHSQVAMREQNGRVFAVTAMTLDFVRPARLEDELDVLVDVQDASRARIDFVQRVERRGEELVRATVRAACLDAERFVPVRMPGELFTQIIEARGNQK